jgi:predicted secreted protein
MRNVVLLGVFSIALFTTLFCLLPLGLGGGGHDENGAPNNPRILLKLAISFAVAIVAWGIVYFLEQNGTLDF